MIDAADFELARDLVRRRAGIVLDDGKEYLVETRLASACRHLSLDGPKALLDRVRAGDGALALELVEALTTNETSWFRDPRVYTALETGVFPALLDARRSARRLRIWSAACSTGQEPYTVAIMLESSFPETARWDVEIVATDLDTKVLEKAEAGVYNQLEVNRGLPARTLLTHFERDGRYFRAKDTLRSKVSFRQLNLIEDSYPQGPFDLVLIRNVLIYFDLETKRSVLDRVLTRVAPDGYVVLGGAETTLNVHEGYARERVGEATVYRPGGGIAKAS
ncbi:MAG: protein-glutamate O-methyltransferase CheR [Myxococcota bacterium]